MQSQSSFITEPPADSSDAMATLPTFLGLPVELRLRIYDWTFADSHVH